MKNKLLNLILALFLPLVSAGQQSLTAYLLTSGPYSDPGTLVCNIDDDHVCTYFTNPITGYKTIGVMDITGFTAGMSVSPSATILWDSSFALNAYTFTDMQFHNGYVYLCGTNGTTGVLVCVNPYAMIYRVFDFPALDAVLRLVVYSDNITGYNRIAAIGKRIDKHLLMDIPVFYPTMTSFPYRMTELTGETIDEILLTGKHVVLVGRETDTVHNSLCYRVTEASNVTDSPALRYVYRHPGLGASISGQVRATATETSEFAVAYMQGTDTVKMLTLAINPADEVVLTGAQKSTAGNELRAMAYHPDQQLLSLLWPGAHPTRFSRFLLMRPYGTAPYATGEVLCGRIECHALDDVGGIGFVAAGANGVTVQRVDAISPFPSCHNVFTTTVLPASVPRMESEPLVERLIEQASYFDFWKSFADENLLSVPCNQ